jgi:hypothetical protein
LYSLHLIALATHAGVFMIIKHHTRHSQLYTAPLLRQHIATVGQCKHSASELGL